MHPLLRTVVVLFLGFAATFLVIKVATGLSFDDVELWLHEAQRTSPATLAGLVVALLLADILVSVPTLTITMLAGFLLGQFAGATAALLGLYGAGLIGYSVSRVFGDRLLCVLMKDDAKRMQVRETFAQHGFGMIILARAAPILPEVTACLAGATRMSLSRFLAAWSLNSIPYVFVATLAGSLSSLENPQPALFTAFGISATLWVSWFLFRRRMLVAAAASDASGKVPPA